MKDKLIAKQKELIELLYNQVDFVAGDMCIEDSEKFGYTALAFSQKITKIELEIALLEKQVKKKDNRPLTADEARELESKMGF